MDWLTSSQLNNLITGVNSIQYDALKIGDSLKSIVTFGFELDYDVTIKVEDVFSFSENTAFNSYLRHFIKKLSELAHSGNVSGKYYDHLIIVKLPVEEEALATLGSIGRLSRLFKTKIVVVDLDSNFMNISDVPGEVVRSHVSASHLPGEMKLNVFSVSYEMLDNLDILMQSQYIHDSSFRVVKVKEEAVNKDMNSEMFVLSKVKMLHIMRSFKQSDDLKHIHIAGLNMRIETPLVFGVEVAATEYTDVDSFKHYLHTLQQEYEYRPDQITFVVLRDVHGLGNVDDFVNEFQSLLRNARSKGIHLVMLDDASNRDFSIPGFRVIELAEETIFEKMFEDLADVIIFVGESVRDCAKSAIQTFSHTEAPVHKTGIRLEHLDRNATEDVSRLLSIYDIAVKQFAIGEDVEWTVFTLNDSERVSDSVHALLGSLSNVTYIDNTDGINSCIEQLVKSIFRHEVDETAPTQLLVMGSDSAEYMLNAQRVALASLCAGANAGSRIIPLFVNCDSLTDEIIAVGGNRFMVEV